MNRIVTGTYDRILDEKFRLAIPKPLRRQLSQEDEPTLFVAPETDHSLSVYSRERFHWLTEQLKQHATNRADSRNYFRLLFPRADELALDGQGRIRIPERLVEHASLKHDVVIVGVFDHAEIWDKGLWDQFLAANGHQFDEMASRARG